MFFVIGAVTGWLGDQKRRESGRAERINTELQSAYAELRQTVGQLLQAERLSSLAEIASGVSGATWLGMPPGNENCLNNFRIPASSSEMFG